MKTTSNGRGPQNINRGISQQPLYGCDFGVFWGKLEENSEEFSSVALLSPACYTSLTSSVVLSLLS